MKQIAFLSAALMGALSLTAAAQSGQREEPRRDSPAPVHVTVPPGGFTFNFADIDRNRDNSISVEEWNAFVAALPSRMGRTEPGSAAAGGGSAAEKQPQQPRR